MSFTGSAATAQQWVKPKYTYFNIPIQERKFEFQVRFIVAGRCVIAAYEVLTTIMSEETLFLGYLTRFNENWHSMVLSTSQKGAFSYDSAEPPYTYISWLIREIDKQNNEYDFISSLDRHGYIPELKVGDLVLIAAPYDSIIMKGDTVKILKIPLRSQAGWIAVGINTKEVIGYDKRPFIFVEEANKRHPYSCWVSLSHLKWWEGLNEE